jgi:predicted heme/steroid binding protein
MTKEELAKFDGRDGRKAYVAVSEKVYDVTDSPLWQAGDHQGMHQAGVDLTEELKTAPHVRTVVDNFPIVDHLVEPEPPKKKKWGIF